MSKKDSKFEIKENINGGRAIFDNSYIKDQLESIYSSFDYVKISIASPDRIKQWGSRKLKIANINSYSNKKHFIGEISSAETLKDSNLRPIDGGLFCEKIFGPVKSGQCQCGHGSKQSTIGLICPTCYVEFTDARVRRYRMGIFTLAFPNYHMWFLKGQPSYLSLILNISKKQAEDIFNCSTKIENNHYNDAQNSENFIKEIKLSSDLNQCVESSLEKLDNCKYNASKAIFKLSRKVSSYLCYDIPKSSIKLIKDLLDNLGSPCLQQEHLIKFAGSESQLENKTNKNIYDHFRELYIKKRNKKSEKNIKVRFISENDTSLKLHKSNLENNSEILHSMLNNIDLKQEIESLRSKMIDNGLLASLKSQCGKRLRVLESFAASKIAPSSMLLICLPILPPALRPIQELENGRIISSDLNELYKGIIKANNRIYAVTKLVGEKRVSSTILATFLNSAQNYLNRAIDNSRLNKTEQAQANQRPLKALTEILEGKEGRFRQNLLGKRVDYSGRSVIVVGPELKLDQCGLPYHIAKTLFEPFILRMLFDIKKKVLDAENADIRKNDAAQIGKKFLKSIIDKNRPIVWELLFKLCKNYSILLNRAPTLHKFSIQAFDPIINFEKAVKLHPLMCPGFNADFDGDQMGIYLPLYNASQIELKGYIKGSSNVCSPANGEIMLKPSQDIVIGSFYLTMMGSRKLESLAQIFSAETEIIEKLNKKAIGLHSPIFLRANIQHSAFFVENGYVFLSESLHSSENINSKIKKIIKGNDSTLYLVTSMGVFVGKAISEKHYQIFDYLIETTPGRVLFGIGIKNI